MNRRWNRTLAAAAAAFLFAAGSGRAQHEGHKAPEATPDGACAARARTSLRLVEETAGRLDAARQSNNPAALRAAVDDLQLQLAKIRTELSACVEGPPEKTKP